jgi:hypothetical protein
MTHAPLGERELSCDGDLGLVACDGDWRVGGEASLAVHLDAVVEELLEGGHVEHSITDWLGAVNGVLDGLLL